MPKKSARDPFSDFVKLLEKQRKQMEKLAKPLWEYPKRMEKVLKPFMDYQKQSEKLVKPVLQYHQKLLEEVEQFREQLTQNVIETLEKTIDQMSEEYKNQTQETDRLLSETDIPDYIRDYIKNTNKIQERWIESLKKTIGMIKGFAKHR
jgi:Ni,Fe-hydrogenase I large subunit